MKKANMSASKPRIIPKNATNPVNLPQSKMMPVTKAKQTVKKTRSK